MSSSFCVDGIQICDIVRNKSLQAIYHGRSRRGRTLKGYVLRLQKEQDKEKQEVRVKNQKKIQKLNLRVTVLNQLRPIKIFRSSSS